MKCIVIGDELTVTGFKLIGLSGIVAESAEEARNALDDVRKQEEVALILITERVAEQIRDSVDAVKLNTERPLILEIPDRHGKLEDKESILDVVQRVIGVKL